MSLEDAGNILRRNGINTRNLDDATVRRVLASKPEDQARNIALAYRVFRSPQTSASAAEVTGHHRRWVPGAEGAANDERPVWAKGLRDWTIHRQNFTDANFVRETIWKESGEPTGNPLTLWSFNGERFFQHIVVFGRASAHKTMAKAMVGLANGQTVDAVFMSGKSGRMVLIYLKGRILNQPVLFKHRAMDGNPANDWDFIATLPRKLAELNSTFEQVADPKAGNYKAWVNVNSNKLVAFDANQTFFDALRDHAAEFKVGGTNMLNVRIAAERLGWAAVGVNAKDGKLGAMVTAMNDEMALKAARALFKARWSEGNWDSLVVKTNESSIKLTSLTDIAVYLKTGRKVPPEKDDSFYI